MRWHTVTTRDNHLMMPLIQKGIHSAYYAFLHLWYADLYDLNGYPWVSQKQRQADTSTCQRNLLFLFTVWWRETLRIVPFLLYGTRGRERLEIGKKWIRFQSFIHGWMLSWKTVVLWVFSGTTAKFWQGLAGLTLFWATFIKKIWI